MNSKEKNKAIPKDKVSKASKWKQKAKWIKDNAHWRKDAALIAMRILDALEQQKLKQKDLAERLDISPQAITKIVKGRQNLSLGTIRKIENALDIQLLSIQKPAPQKERVKIKMVPVNIHFNVSKEVFQGDINSLETKPQKESKLSPSKLRISA